MKMRKRKLGTKALEKRLRYHDRYCNIHVYSGDRHCTCGRNQAIAELRVLLKKATWEQSELLRVEA